MKIKIYFGLMTLGFNVIAQQNPTGSAPPANTPLNLPSVQNMVEKAWYRGGNFSGGSAGINNIFGTMWNSPIYTVTDGQQRTRLNGTLVSTAANPLNGVVGQNTSGYFGISPQGFFANNSPWAMLHLDGPNNTGFNGDWRSWMKTGVYMRENSDAMYVGLKDEFSTSGLNRSDAVINWSDDPTNGGGVDKLRFLFTSTAPSGSGSGTDPRNGASFNGYEFMRMQSFPAINNGAGFPIGHVGIGPMFTNALPPQNRLHMNSEDNLATFMQISNSNTANGTGQTVNDGLHIGYPTTAASFLTVHINQKENDNMLMFTNNGERIRVSHIDNVSTANMNPFAKAANLTRVSISHDPAQPLTRPLALLHLGYNTGNAFAGVPNGTDGVRDWMEVGTLVSRTTDHVFVGLKPITNNGLNGFNRQDAVIAWGDDYNTGGLPGVSTGPDKLRVIFTSPTPNLPFPGPGAMATNDGLEFVRYVPFHNTSLNVNDPRTGFGDFNSLTPVGTIDPGNTIEINSIMNGFNATANTNVTGSYLGSTGASGLRFRDLTSQSTVVPSTITAVDQAKVLSVDNLGNVVLIDNGGGGLNCWDTNGDGILQATEDIIPDGIGNYLDCQGPQGIPGPTGPTGPAGGIVNAQNGLSLLNSSTVELGRALGSGGVLANLLNNREIPLNNFNLVFTVPGSAPNSASNHIGIGTTSPVAQVHIKSFSNAGTTEQFRVDDSNNNVSFVVKDNQRVGIGTNNPTTSLEIKTKTNSGVAPGITMDSETNFPSNFLVFKKLGTAKWNITHYDGGNSQLKFSKGTETAPNTFMYLDDNLNSVNILKPTFINGTPNASGNILEVQGQSFLNGNITGSGTDSHLSDVQFKTNVDSISNAINIIKQLKPKQYYFDTTNVYGLFFDAKKQYGLIAQDIETILPELVSSATKSAELDTAGNVVKPSVTFKTLNYNSFFGIMIKALQEQQHTIDIYKYKDSIQDARLTALENAIAQCCSNASARNANSNINQLDVELSDKDAIVLNQNVPNPFAEQTTITYNVPTSVEKAQLIFFNANGQVIQTVDIKTRGKGKVNVFASDLSSGLYHYTLVADGKVVDSKKMVRE